MSGLADPGAAAFDPHTLWAIALVALAIVVALLVLCAGIDKPQR